MIVISPLQIFFVALQAGCSLCRLLRAVQQSTRHCMHEDLFYVMTLNMIAALHRAEILSLSYRSKRKRDDEAAVPRDDEAAVHAFLDKFKFRKFESGMTQLRALRENPDQREFLYYLNACPRGRMTPLQQAVEYFRVIVQASDTTEVVKTIVPMITTLCEWGADSLLKTNHFDYATDQVSSLEAVESIQLIEDSPYESYVVQVVSALKKAELLKYVTYLRHSTIGPGGTFQKIMSKIRDCYQERMTAEEVLQFIVNDGSVGQIKDKAHWYLPYVFTCCCEVDNCDHEAALSLVLQFLGPALYPSFHDLVKEAATRAMAWNQPQIDEGHKRSSLTICSELKDLIFHPEDHVRLTKKRGVEAAQRAAAVARAEAEAAARHAAAAADHANELAAQYEAEYPSPTIKSVLINPAALREDGQVPENHVVAYKLPNGVVGQIAPNRSGHGSGKYQLEAKVADGTISQIVWHGADIVWPT